MCNLHSRLRLRNCPHYTGEMLTIIKVRNRNTRVTLKCSSLHKVWVNRYIVKSSIQCWLIISLNSQSKNDSIGRVFLVRKNKFYTQYKLVRIYLLKGPYSKSLTYVELQHKRLHLSLIKYK